MKAQLTVAVLLNVFAAFFHKVASEADVCPNHRLYDPISSRTYRISDTRIGQIFSSHQLCLANGQPYVVLQCLDSGQFGVQWSEFIPNQACNYTLVTTSSITHVFKQLMNVMLMTGEETAVRSALEKTLETIVTSVQQSLSAMDIVYIADIIQLSVQQPSLSVQDANTILQIVDILVDVEDDVLQESRLTGNATNRIIISLERLGDKVPLNQHNQSLRLLADSVAYEIWDLSHLSDRSSPLVIGLEKRVSDDVESHVVRSRNLFTLFEDDDVDFNRTDVAIVLPVEFLRNVTEGNPGQDIRLTMGVYVDTSLFGNGSLESRMPKKADEFYALNSRVVSARVTVNGRPVTDLSGYNVTTAFLPNQTMPEEQRHVRHTRCVFWNFSGEAGLAAWSDEGCTSQDADNGRDVCQFDHLTNFAVLMDLYGQGDLLEEHQTILGVISIIGLSLSIVALSCTVLAFLRSSKLRQGRRQKVLFNLALALLLSWVVFLAGFTRHVHPHVTGCLVVSALLHYLVLASFLWMLMEGVLQYLLFVRVFNTFSSNFVAKTMVVAWGLPLLPVITILSIDPDLYSGGDQYCWMSLQPFYYAFLLPVAVILLTNIIIYVLVVVHICRRSKVTPTAVGRHNVSSRRAVGFRASFACFVVLGLSWLFAFLAIGDARVVFQYLFTVTTSLQGLLIFLVFTARQANVRGLLRRVTHWRYRAGSSSSSSRCSSSPTNSTDTGRSKVTVVGLQDMIIHMRERTHCM